MRSLYSCSNRLYSSWSLTLPQRPKLHGHFISEKDPVVCQQESVAIQNTSIMSSLLSLNLPHYEDSEDAAEFVLMKECESLQFSSSSTPTNSLSTVNLKRHFDLEAIQEHKRRVSLLQKVASRLALMPVQQRPFIARQLQSLSLKYDVKVPNEFLKPPIACRIIVSGWDQELLTSFCEFCARGARALGYDVPTPVALKSHIDRWTFLDSPFKHKYARVQFERRDYRFMLIFHDPESGCSPELRKTRRDKIVWYMRDNMPENMDMTVYSYDAMSLNELEGEFSTGKGQGRRRKEPAQEGNLRRLNPLVSLKSIMKFLNK